MEIDLNLAVCDEVEKNACSLSSPTSSYSSNAATSASSFSSSPSSTFAPSSSIHVELWRACAGPVPIQHKKGDLVVYFPQQHPNSSTRTHLPPRILCRVVDVQLLANSENDEVYTQLSLHPMPEMVGEKLEGKESEHVGFDEGGNGDIPPKSSSHMFCKILTASDTSAHGGFSVPRRAAEDCFPPLNYKEERPNQELIATDLHGVEWKFRHIYRGQPRRHLLTTGWSIFVSRKNLVSGDAVLFLRGESGELRLGIRRAARAKNGLPDSVTKNQNYYPNLLSNVASALASNGMFNIVYSPRESHSSFIVPYQDYLKCTASQSPEGTRFKTKHDLDDPPERRFSGASDADPYRRPNSKWRSPMIGWDNVINHHQERVPPWDIDSSSSTYAASLSFQPLKRLKSSNLQTSAPSPLSSGGGLVSEYVRSSKVLQGQENVAKRMRNGEFVIKQASVENKWFPKVLQGQEICGFYPLASEGARRLPFQLRNPVLRSTPEASTDINGNELVGRAVDLSQLHGSHNLLFELERLLACSEHDDEEEELVFFFLDYHRIVLV